MLLFFISLIKYFVLKVFKRFRMKMQSRKSGPVLEENWRGKCTGVCNRFEVILLEKSFLWDIGFQVGSKVFKAHKLVLSLGSRVFEDMFYSADAEDKYMMVISDVDPDGFRNLLRYLYTGCIMLTCIPEAVSAYEAGEKYDVPELKVISEKFLSEQDYKPSVVWPVLENAELYDMSLTRKRCLEFVRRNTREVLKTEGFLSSSFRVVQTILGLNEVSIPEIELLDFLARWVKRKTGRNSSSTQPVFDALAPYIRFNAIRPEELCSFMQKHPECLDDNDSMQILKHLVKPDSTPLPEWCNRQSARENSSQPRKTFTQKLWNTLKNPELF